MDMGGSVKVEKFRIGGHETAHFHALLLVVTQEEAQFRSIGHNLPPERCHSVDPPRDLFADDRWNAQNIPS